MRLESAKLLEDIRDAAQFVLDDTAGESLKSYLRDRRFRNSVERNFEIMGEAMRRLSDIDLETARRISGRRQIIAFRNLLIHAYDIVDHERVWEIVQDSLPTLRSEVEALLGELDARDDLR